MHVPHRRHLILEEVSEAVELLVYAALIHAADAASHRPQRHLILEEVSEAVERDRLRRQLREEHLAARGEGLLVNLSEKAL